MKRSFIFLPVVLAVSLSLFSCPPPAKATEDDEDTVYETRDFWVDTGWDDMAGEYGWEEITTRRLYQGDHCNVWVSEKDVGNISQSLIDAYGKYFDDRSWGDVTSYVNMPDEFFGEKKHRINILFYNMYDSGIAGYFWSKDFYTDADLRPQGYRSNETNVFYMNISAAVDPADQDYATLFTNGTLSHEFQHMCNAQYFFFGEGKYKEREMDSWANEFCSTTTESLFADQYAVYANVFNHDPDGDDDGLDDYAHGQTDFIYWENNFTQYTTTAMLGGYVLSQLPAANRPDFIKKFLAHTYEEDPTPLEYTNGALDTDCRTSVEDLIMTLQDPDVAFDAEVTGWEAVADADTDTDEIANDWAVLLKNFVGALATGQADYVAYLNSVTRDSADPDVTVVAPLVPVAAAGFMDITLLPSGFAIGKTRVDSADLGSEALGDMDTSEDTDVYVLVCNAAIPSYSVISADTKDTTLGGVAELGGSLVARPAPLVTSPKAKLAQWAISGFNRSFSRMFGSTKATFEGIAPVSAPVGRAVIIPSPGDAANPSIGGGGGNLFCAYVAVP